MVSIPHPVTLGAGGGRASGLPAMLSPPRAWPLSPQALPAASAAALHRHRGDGALLALRGLTVPDALCIAIRDSDSLYDRV